MQARSGQAAGQAITVAQRQHAGATQSASAALALIIQEKSFTMNNNDLAESLAATHALTKANARQLVDDLFAAIVDAAARGEEVSLTGFGKFKVKATPAREGRNPATGATIQIAAAKKIAFTPAKAVKDRLSA